MSETPIRREGFEGERHWVLPEVWERTFASHPVIGALYPTAAGLFPYAAGHLVNRRSGRPDYLVMVCMEGRGWCRMVNRSLRLRPHTCVVVPPGTPHAYGSTKRYPWSIVWVHFAGERADALVQSLGGPGYPWYCEPLRFMGELVEDLYRGARALARPEDGLPVCARLWRWLGALAEHHQPLDERVRDTETRVRRVERMLREQVGKQHALADLAAEAGCSVPHLMTVFRRLTGTSPIEYSLRAKMDYAARQLAVTEQPIQEVARQVGMEDPLYFSKQFRKRMGVPPSVFRSASSRDLPSLPGRPF